MEPAENVESSGRSSPLPSAEKYKFIGLIVLLFLVAFLHMYVIPDYTGLVGGLPGWVWIQLIVIVVLGFIAWKANWILLQDQEGGGGT